MLSDVAEIIGTSPLQQSSWLILHFGKKIKFLLLVCVYINFILRF